MINDMNFLEKLINQKNRTVYCRLTSLNLANLPVEVLTGQITAGSINLDGASAVRRTCQLSFIPNKQLNYLWAMKTKFKLEIGIENNFNPIYEDIIWFNQGHYIVSSFSTSEAANSITININGKDKMTQLNGELGGTLLSQVNFGVYEEIMEDGSRKIISHPIKHIIKDAVHQFGQEPFENIIINDLDMLGL
jgi:hypothetical protein